MKRNMFGRAVISSLLVATTMVGCSGSAFKPRSSADAVKEQRDAQKQAAATEKALADRDFARALTAAEAAVADHPREAALRQLLGRAYVANGRFVSAETALQDAMTLGNVDARTIISLALVKVGLGKNEEARSLIAAHAGTLPAADYGLAIAMAGDAAQGVDILSQAIHDPSATARTRQNLAYAYALAGRWKDARIMAGEDLAPIAAAQRVSQWAAMADPAMGAHRVAALMGVTVNGADAGQPVALALAPSETPQAFADAAADTPAPPAIDAEAPVELAAIQPVSEPAPVLEVPIIQAASAPVRTAARDFVIEEKGKRTAYASALARPAKAAKPVIAPAVATMQKAAFIKPAGSAASNWVVQLGAYDSPAIAKERWTRMATVNNNLAAFPVLTSSATVKGKNFHRLAVGGFANRGDAMAMCRTIQTQKGQCFVREAAPGATPQRWALATRGRQFASR